MPSFGELYVIDCKLSLTSRPIKTLSHVAIHVDLSRMAYSAFKPKSEIGKGYATCRGPIDASSEKKKKR